MGEGRGQKMGQEKRLRGQEREKRTWEEQRCEEKGEKRRERDE